MRNATAGSRQRRTFPPHPSRALEELVWTVATLDGPRAATLLSGLADPLQPTALGILERAARRTRGERHARLARVFAPRPMPLATSEEIPGLLGTEVRNQLSSRDGAATSSASERMTRWARRLLAERGELGTDRDP